MKKQTHVSILISIILLSIVIHYVAMPFLYEYSFPFQLLIGMSSLFIDIIACSYILYFSNMKEGLPRLFWTILSVGTLSYFIGDIVVSYQRLILKDYYTFVDPSDFFYLLFLMSFAFAFLYEIIYNRDLLEKLFMICDICIIVTAQFTLSYYLLIERTIHVFTTSYVDIFVQLTYPMADLLFLLIGINLLFKPLSLLPKKVGALLGSALILYATTDAIYAYIKYFTPEYSMFTVTPLYQVTLVLVAIACILHTKEPEKQEQVLLTPKLGESIRLSLPYISVVMLIVFILVEYVFAPIVVIGLMITFSFVLIRHSLVRKQNKILLLAQMQFNSELEKQIELRTEDLVEQKNELYHNQQMFKSLYEHHPDPIFTLDLYGNFLNVNNAGTTLLGYQTNELLNQPYYSLMYEEDLEEIINAFHRVKKGKSISLEVRAYHKNRDIYYLHVTAVPIFLKNHISGVYLMIKDITESKQQQEQINFLAYHDTLTELANRRAFHQYVEQAIARSEISKRPFAVMFLDLDRFKIINDTLGHRVGDLLLIAVAKRLERLSTPNMKLARLAGDEFTILIENYKKRPDIQKIADTIVVAMNEPFEIENQHLQISPSIGIAIYPEAGEDPLSILQHADMAMYEAKNKGKNGSSLYTKELYKKMERKARIEKDLPLGHWVLKESCRQLKIWHTFGYQDLKISVNLSAKEFQQDHLIKHISQILTDLNIDPKYVTLELTERIAMIDEKETLARLKQLKEYGIQTSIDDFGTGYSSLAYLSIFPIDTLKVPREFTQLADHRPEERAIVSTILSLANTLNLSVVAEGIETEKQLKFLQKNNCKYMQGYYFSKPLTSHQFIKFLQKTPSMNQ
ncbi:putative bifunctional diguanylate cyclase/phosphodiesterase [Bacillus mobilis]|uniref:putative bifunctional diguanylate cyclase/phosphodiesterase n=1 Tax=Bacillus mobilis TaxID=2026190 RepID=UPI0021D1E956|nr:EAL domain-containing protein [Bacillus mobilis]MCU5195575.1 diguanylate cyclase [Bacillus mobilis]